MKKIISGVLLILGLALVSSSCRPPDLEGAFVHYNAGRYDQALELAEKAANQNPNNSEAWYLLGELYSKKKQFEKMNNAFTKSLAIDQKFSAQINTAKSTNFNKLYNDGVSTYNDFIKMEDKNTDAAKQKLNQLVENFSNANIIRSGYMATRLIANAYQNIDDHENALKYLTKATEVKPDTVLGWVELGYLHFRLKDYVKSAQAFQKGLDVDSGDTECLTMFAQSLDFGDKKEEAISAYKNALAKNPEEKAIPFNLGLLIYKEANADGVDEAKRKAYLEESTNYLKKAHELDPELKDIYDLLGSILISSERYDEALELLLKGTEIFPGASTIWYNLGVLYAREGLKDKAKEAFDRAEKLKEN